MNTKKIINYLLQGLFITAPIAFTVYALIKLFTLIDGIIPIRDWLEEAVGFKLYGLGFLAILLFLIIVGYFSTNFFISKIMGLVEGLIKRSKFINQIYSSIKDLVGAFAGDEKRFEQPVLVMIDKENNLQRMGFITQDDLEDIGVAGKVAVYCPISYSFAGDLVIVPKESITMVNGISSTEAMKFIVSGGVTKLDD